MKKVTDYVEVGELCETDSGVTLICVADKLDDSKVCPICSLCDNGTDCSEVMCMECNRQDDTAVHFELANSK